MKQTIETKTAETVLETPFSVSVGGKSYEVARPTLSTLIEVSKFISQLPESIETVEQNDDAILKEVLSIAFDCGYLGDIVAILILGSKGIKPTTKAITVKKYGFIPIKKTISVNPQAELSQIILEELDPKELFNMTISLLHKLEVAFFLSTLIFLKGVNLLRKTKF